MDVLDRLHLILDWYRGMISDRTGRLVYVYEPEQELVVADGSAIRDIASIWDVELLGRFLARDALSELTTRSLEHYLSALVDHDGGLILDSARLDGASGIAHSAFLILGLLESELAEREVATVLGLAEAILRQQRQDGSYRIYFGEFPDEGVEFYPGEAMLALMHAHALDRGPRYIDSVERGFGYFDKQLPPDAVDHDLLVFFGNWQSQYAARLHAASSSESVRDAVRDYVFALHDRILESGFYEAIERHPARQATVEVACALEGLNDAFSIATREGDDRRLRTYAAAARTALAWLCRAQRLTHCTPRERGGFGHSLADRTQRIDVTGHVVGAFIKTVRNGLVGDRGS